MTTQRIGAAFRDDLLREMPDDAARRAARRVLKRWAGERLHIPGARADEARLAAAAMLDAMASGYDVPAAAQTLARRIGRSESHARRLLREEKGRRDHFSAKDDRSRVETHPS